MLKTLPTNPAIRPGYETEAELAAILWAAQKTLGEAIRDVEAYCDRGGDLHGGNNLPALIVSDARACVWMRQLARRLDRTIGED